jgi:hypothetical protein
MTTVRHYRSAERTDRSPRSPLHGGENGTRFKVENGTSELVTVNVVVCMPTPACASRAACTASWYPNRPIKGAGDVP